MIRTWLALLAVLVPAVASAQDSAAETAALKKEIASLERRLEALEKRPTGSGDAAADYAEIALRIQTMQEQLEIMMKEEEVTYAPVDVPPPLSAHFHGYADVGFAVLAPMGDEVEDGAVQLGVEASGLELGWAADLGEHAALDSAVVFGLNERSLPMVEVDRFSITLSPSRAFNVRAGKIYSPYGYWNTHLPLGSYELPSASRPMVLSFEREGASFATRQGGIDLFGEYTVGMSRLGYHLGVGNGRSPYLMHTQDIVDTSIEKAVWVQLSVETAAGLEIGVSGAYDPIRVSEEGPVPGEPALKQDVNEMLAVGHVAWRTQRMLLLFEYFLIAHTPGEGALDNEWLSEDQSVSRSAYLQWSHRLPALTPYLRADYHEQAYDDVLYYDLGDQYTEVAGTLGVRKDLDVHAALSAEIIGGKRIEYTFPTSPAATVLGGGLYLQAAF